MNSRAINQRWRTIKTIIWALAAVALAAIDDRSIAQLGRFPWPRSIEASLVKALAADGAKVIAFDMFFSERDPADVERERITTRLRAASVNAKTIDATVGLAGDDEF